jgi:hypothetical protein
MLTFHKPTRKKDAFVAKVTADSKPVRIHIHYVKAVNYNGHVMRFWIPEESSANALLRTYDTECLEATLANNVEWFSNALEPESIHAFFRNSVSKNVIATLVSDVKPPTVYFNRELLPETMTLADIPLQECRMSAEIEIQGLYFFSQRFGIRWILRTLRIEKEREDHKPDETPVAKSDIEATWESDLRQLDEAIQTDIDAYMGRISTLETLKHDAHSMLESATSKSSCSDEWNELLSQLASKVAKYYAGGLFYL